MVGPNKLLDVFINILETAGYASVSSYPGFKQVTSKKPDDPWHNFLVVVDPNRSTIDIDAMMSLFELESRRGVKLSIYINKEFEGKYRNFIEDSKLTVMDEDNYVVRRLTKKSKVHPVSLPDGYEISDDYSLEEVIDVLTASYAGWDGEKIYSETFELAKKRMYDNYFFKTYVVRFDGEVVAAASLAVDLVNKIGHMHNSGVLADHRRKGLFTALVNKMLDVCLKSGVTNVFAIVSNDGASHKALEKLGFSSKEKYTLYE